MKHVVVRGKERKYYLFPQLRSTVAEEDLQTGKTFIGFSYPDGKRYFIRHLQNSGKSDIQTLLMFQESLIRGDTVHYSGAVEIVQENGHLFIVRDFAEGLNLKSVLRKYSFNSRRSTISVLLFFVKLLESVGKIHSANITHCNLRPSVIYIGYHGKKRSLESQNPVITDFSMARTEHFMATDNAKLPTTFIYNAPEVILSKHELIGIHSDIYSLGIILYEILKGHHPFRVKHPKVVGDMHLSTPIADFRGIDPAIRSIIEKATSRTLFTRSPHKSEPQKVKSILAEGIAGRYSSASEMAADIIKVLDKFGSKEYNTSKAATSENCKQLKHPVVVFDDMCVLCSRSLQYLIKHDKHQILRYVGLSNAYSAGLHKHIEKFDKKAGIILIDNDRLYTKSDAFIKIMHYLGGWHLLMTSLQIIPTFIRNAFYNVIAKNRYKWWGRRNECYVPPLYEKFLFTGISAEEILNKKK